MLPEMIPLRITWKDLKSGEVHEKAVKYQLEHFDCFKENIVAENQKLDGCTEGFLILKVVSDVSGKVIFDMG